MELPHDFIHKAPEGMYYEAVQFKRDVTAIWIHYQRRFDYNLGDAVRCIWGFYNTKTKQYHAPINSSKQGDTVDIADTTPYSAMQLNYKGLESFFV